MRMAHQSNPRKDFPGRVLDTITHRQSPSSMSLHETQIKVKRGRGGGNIDESIKPHARKRAWNEGNDRGQKTRDREQGVWDTGQRTGDSGYGAGDGRG